MSTDNIIPIGGQGNDDSYQRKNEVLVMIDKARGVVEVVSLHLMESSDNGLQVDCSCALDLACDELQHVRDLYAQIVGI
jgi:hypothetical protein